MIFYFIYLNIFKVNEQNVIMSNKQKFNLEETKTEFNNNYMNNLQKKIEGGENVIKKVKIPNKYLGKRTVFKKFIINKNSEININNNINLSQNDS